MEIDRERGAWKYKDGALIATSSGPIGRDFKLPDMSSIRVRRFMASVFAAHGEPLHRHGGNYGGKLLHAAAQQQLLLPAKNAAQRRIEQSRPAQLEVCSEKRRRISRSA